MSRPRSRGDRGDGGGRSSEHRPAGQRRQHPREIPPRLPSSRVQGGSSNGGSRGRQRRRQNRGNHAALPPPPRTPMGCLRSAELIYELFERKTKIGRGNNCDIVLSTSKSISSAHAVVLFSGPSQASLRDLNSTNGTFVNNVRVHNDVYPLESGDILRFGCDIQSYRFELVSEMPEYESREKQKRTRKQKKKLSRSSSPAAGASTHRKRRSDSPGSRSPSRSPSREFRRRQWGDGSGEGAEDRRQQQEAPHLRTSPGNVGLDEKEDDAPRSPLSPPPVPRSSNVGAELSDSLESHSQSQSQADLSIKLAHAQGARQGRLEAELEDLKRRLAESDGRSMGIAQYRRERRALLRRERKRIGSGASDNEENGPDSDLMVYRTAHGIVRELSPSRRNNGRSKRRKHISRGSF